MSATAAADEPIAAELRRGEALHRSGKLDEAEAVYRAIVERHPRKARAITLLGTLCLQRGRAEEAIRLLESALAIDPRQPAALNNLGMALNKLGRHEAALARFDKAVALKPDYARALYNRGNTLYVFALYERAIADFDAAIALDPKDTRAHNDRANALQALGRDDEAMAGFDRAIALKPDYAEAHYNRANLLAKRGGDADALSGFERALALRPDFPAALNGRGRALERLGRRGEALDSYERAIALKPDHARAHANRGRLLEALGRRDEALESYEAALAAMPRLETAQEGRRRLLRALGRPAPAPPDEPVAKPSDEAGALNRRANLLQRLGRHEEALAEYKRALALRPNMASAHYNRGIALRRLGRFEEAVASYDRAIALKPDYAKAHANRGTALSKLGRRVEAVASYDRALALDPQDARAFNNRGIALMALGRHDEAMASFERVIALQPDEAMGHWSKSHLLLLQGRFEEGWALYERRLEHGELELAERKFEQPRWRGDEPLDGRTILLYAEQGFGDTIQFCRYVELVARRGADVVLEVQAPLVPLMASLRGAATVVAAGEPLPAFDCQASLLSLPYCFGTRLDSVPAPTPYLRAEQERTARWSARLAERPRPRVGLVWAGRPDHTNDRERSIPLDRLRPLLEGGASFIGLQKEVRADDRAALASMSALENAGPSLGDFGDAAALVAALDLVIGVDTSVVHLAGALGKPVWIMLPYAPDWRWLLDREDSPWYPSARLFRQAAGGDWDEVVQRVAAALQRFAPQSAGAA